MWIGATGNAATRSEYDMNGGLLDMSGNTLGVGLGAGVLITGVVNQVSGVITNVGNLWLGGATPNGYGAYNLSGGSIYIGTNVVSGTSGITTFSGLYAVNLGGGTIGAETSWSSPLNMNLTGVNGATTFDTAANTIALSGALSGTGGLTKLGSGTLDLASPGYTGDTTVKAGVLQLDAAFSSLASTYRITNGAQLNLTYSGASILGHFYTNGVALPNGTYNAGNLPAFIIGSGAEPGVLFEWQLPPVCDLHERDDWCRRHLPVVSEWQSHTWCDRQQRDLEQSADCERRKPVCGGHQRFWFSDQQRGCAHHLRREQQCVRL